MTRTYARLGDRLIYIGGLPTAETFALPLLELGVSTYSSALYNFLPEFALSFFDAVRARDRGAFTAGSTTSSCPTPISATGPRAARSRSSRRA
jgi:5-dehydro-4-deoxyglucarate dehydratase